MKAEKRRILIVGAGLSGLALYLALDKKKFDVTIVERRESLANLGYAVIFMPNGVAALRALGFSAAALSKLGKPIEDIEIRDTRGVLSAVTHLKPFVDAFDKYFVVERKTLYALLQKRVSKRAFRFGTYPISLTEKKGSVSVEFSNKKEAEEYDLVVGADGGNSFVRQAIFPKAKITPQNRVFVWTWLPRRGLDFKRKVIALDNKHYGVGFLDVRDSKKICSFLYADTKILPKKFLSASYKKVWSKYLKSFTDPLSSFHAVLPGGGEMYFHEDREVNLKKWNKGRVVLIGDAAHARSVLTGAGTALALEDGVVLGQYLNQKKDVDKAIQTFVGTQYPRVKKMVPCVGKPQERLLSKFFSASILLKKNPI